MCGTAALWGGRTLTEMNMGRPTLPPIGKLRSDLAGVHKVPDHRTVETVREIHTGEVELRGDDVSGLGVHIASRIESLAGPSEVLVSRTVTDLVTGSGLEFTDRGPHDLKGVPGSWQLFLATG
jgi:class 3 adenylate cyclase